MSVNKIKAIFKFEGYVYNMADFHSESDDSGEPIGIQKGREVISYSFHSINDLGEINNKYKVIIDKEHPAIKDLIKTPSGANRYEIEFIPNNNNLFYANWTCDGCGKQFNQYEKSGEISVIDKTEEENRKKRIKELKEEISFCKEGIKFIESTGDKTQLAQAKAELARLEAELKKLEGNRERERERERAKLFNCEVRYSV